MTGVPMQVACRSHAGLMQMFSVPVPRAVGGGGWVSFRCCLPLAAVAFGRSASVVGWPGQNTLRVTISDYVAAASRKK